MQLLRSTLFSLGFVISTICASTMSLFIWPLKRNNRYQLLQFWSVFNVWWMNKSCNIEYEVHGEENIPKDIPCVIVSNHQSTWETIAFQRVFPSQVYVIKKELLWIPFFGLPLRLISPIVINRSKKTKARQQILLQGKQHLDNGLFVIIFPEGTRAAPKSRSRYSTGGAMLALKSGYHVLPVVHNSGDCWPKSTFLKQSGIVHEHIGESIHTDGKTAKEINNQVEQWADEQLKILPKRGIHHISSDILC